MTGFLEDDALRFEGLDDQDIAELNAILPDLQILNAQIAAQWPRIQKAAPILSRIAGKIIAKQRDLQS